MSFTDKEKKYIVSKITSIRWELIPETLKEFWKEHYHNNKKKKNEK